MKREVLNVEKTIEDALTSEPMRSVPSGMHNRIEQRLKITALIQKEKSQFRRTMVMAWSMIFLCLGGGISFAFYGGVKGLLQTAAPGALGYIDYMSSSYTGATMPSDMLINAIFLLTILGCMTIAGVGLVFRRRLAK